MGRHRHCSQLLIRAGLAFLACVTLAAPVAGRASEYNVGAFFGPHAFNQGNELAQPEGATGGINATVLPGIRLAVWPLRQIGLEMELAGGWSTLNSVYSGAQTVGLANIRAHGVVRATYGPVQVLALGGAGYMRAIASSTVRFANEGYPYGYGGLGVAYALSERWRLRVDGRMHFTASTQVGKIADHEYEATIAMAYHFGLSSGLFAEQTDDADGDGLVDALDNCPFEAETKNGVRDEDGCPEHPEIAKRYHQTQYVKRSDAQLAVLPKATRGQHVPAPPAENKAVVAAPTPTPTDDEDKQLAALQPAAELAPNALPPLVGPGDDDHDGLDRADDVCPDNAEDQDGFEDPDGCPDPDNDQDGVLDAQDNCPFEPEIVNGVRDDDGCPEDPTMVQRYHQTRYVKIDNTQVAVLPEQATRLERPAGAAPDPEPDALALLPALLPLAPNALPPLSSAGDDDGDGLVRDSDVCPDRAEDFDEFEDGDGCPELDNDLDGVPDANDKCPREGETGNGYDDEDGCPDDIPEPLAQRVGVLQGLGFENNSAQILHSSMPVLTRLAEILIRYPLARVEIAGHTDDSGSRERNTELSQQRSDAVRTWLIGHGGDGNRITAVGYGPDRPKVSNASAKGRAVNRRVEFNLVAAGEEAAPK